MQMLTENPLEMLLIFIYSVTLDGRVINTTRRRYFKFKMLLEQHKKFMNQAGEA